MSTYAGKIVISIVPLSESLGSLSDSFVSWIGSMTYYLGFDLWMFVGIRDV